MTEIGSNENEINKSNNPAGKPEELFELIKKIQSLPDEVVTDFINCKGSINSAGFKEKYLNNVR
ncbi:MAG: hypothetical protein WC061_07530 [Melioribacteraceae bacterium]